MSVKHAKHNALAAVVAVNQLAISWNKLTLKQKVDVFAELKKLQSSYEKMYKNISNEIRNHCNNKDGELAGTDYVAVLQYNPVTRLNSTRLKEEDPETWNKWAEPIPEGKVTYHLKTEYYHDEPGQTLSNSRRNNRSVTKRRRTN